jgi:hypothetical protein
MERVIELYYTVGDLCTLLRYSDTWVKLRIKAGDFGPGVLDIRGEYRIPASGVNVFLTQHRFNPEFTRPHKRSSFLRRMRRNGERPLDGDNIPRAGTPD